MARILTIIFNFLLKSRMIQASIAFLIVVSALSLGSAIILQAKSGKCFTGIFGEIKHIVSEVK